MSTILLLMFFTPPWKDRPANDVGAVGPFTVTSIGPTEPVTMTEPFEYRLDFTGAGDCSQVTPEFLRRDARFVAAFHIVDILPVEKTEAGFTLRYRIQPTSTDIDKIPAVRVAVFNPPSNRFETKLASSLSLSLITSPTPTQTVEWHAPAPIPDRTYRWRLAVGGLVGAGLFLLRRWLARRHATAVSDSAVAPQPTFARTPADPLFRLARLVGLDPASTTVVELIERLQSLPPTAATQSLCSALEIYDRQRFADQATEPTSTAELLKLIETWRQASAGAATV